MSYSLCGKQLQTLCICHGAPMAEQDLQQVLQCHHFRKKLENTEGKVGSILNFPTSQARQHLVTGNFNLAISSHWGPPNIRQNDSNLRDHTVRQTWLETKFNPLLPEKKHLRDWTWFPEFSPISPWCQAKEGSKGNKLKRLCKSNWNWNFSLTCWEETHKLGQLEEAIITGYK